MPDFVIQFQQEHIYWASTFDILQSRPNGKLSAGSAYGKLLKVQTHVYLSNEITCHVKHLVSKLRFVNISSLRHILRCHDIQLCLQEAQAILHMSRLFWS